MKMTLTTRSTMRPTASRLAKLALASALCLGFGSAAWASNSANQSVSVTVSPVNEIAVSGGTISLTVNSATAGQNLNPATDNSTGSLAYTTNVAGGTKKITAAIGSNLATGLTLTVAAGGGSPLTLSTTAVDLVTAIGASAVPSLSLTYSLSATLGVGPVNATSASVTYTLTDT